MDIPNPRLLEVVRAFPYPATPEIATTVRRELRAARRQRAATSPTRRLAWALAVLALAVGGLMAVSQVRAAVAEVLRIGVVRIFLSATPTATPAPPPTATSQAAATARPTSTPFPTATLSSSVLDLAGETTLAEARQKSGFALPLPTYPADLGPPDRVFYQDQNGPVVVLAWLVLGQPGRVRLSLHFLSDQSWGLTKLQPQKIEETTVNGFPAIWAEGPYLMIYRNGEVNMTRMVQGHVLIWDDGRITYRLETDESLDEAVRIAESLK